MVYPKFIVEDGELVMSKVEYHKDLAKDIAKVKGGGMFWFDESRNAFILGGTSMDFGSAEIEDILECIKNDKVFTYKNASDSIAKEHSFYYDLNYELVPLQVLDKQAT